MKINCIEDARCLFIGEEWLALKECHRFSRCHKSVSRILFILRDGEFITDHNSFLASFLSFVFTSWRRGRRRTALQCRSNWSLSRTRDKGRKGPGWIHDCHERQELRFSASSWFSFTYCTLIPEMLTQGSFECRRYIVLLSCCSILLLSGFKWDAMIWADRSVPCFCF